jgi:hypothetical protein
MIYNKRDYIFVFRIVRMCAVFQRMEDRVAMRYGPVDLPYTEYFWSGPEPEYI